MSMSDIRTEIKFGVSAAVSRENIKQSKIDELAYRKERAAEDLGRKIMESKGWRPLEQIEPDLVIASQTFYVFTTNELRDFLDAKLKEKLVQMSQREEEADIADRLMLLSERV